jgi:GntR family transcriptional regulator
LASLALYVHERLRERIRTTADVQERYRDLVSIDHEGREPVYLQLADILEARIRSGELRRGRMIPSESTLQQQYGVSRGTVRKAVAVLRERGLVDTVEHRGSFVL